MSAPDFCLFVYTIEKDVPLDNASSAKAGVDCFTRTDQICIRQIGLTYRSRHRRTVHHLGECSKGGAE